MESNELVKEEFKTLRDEIKAMRSRAFAVVVMGVFGIPVLTYLATSTEKPVMVLVPFSALVLIVAYLTQLSNMMRAARYIREHIEPLAGESLGWEAWLESRGGLRTMEKQFAACLIVILFAYYFVTIGIALDRFMTNAKYDPSGMSAYWAIGLAVTYLIGAVWALATLIGRIRCQRFLGGLLRHYYRAAA